MIFPFVLLIADVMLWWLFSEIVDLGQPLLNIAMFGLAFGMFLWVVWETIELVGSNTSEHGESE